MNEKEQKKTQCFPPTDNGKKINTQTFSVSL